MCHDDVLPDEYYIWQDFTSTKNFNQEVWKHFQVAVKFGRIRWIRYAKCKICKKLVGWSRCTGNLKKHLDVHHKSSKEDNERGFEVILNKSPEEYLKFLENELSKQPILDNEYISGGTLKRYVKYPIWNLYLINRYSKIYVRCRLCNKDVYWNRRGLEKLKSHVDKIHINVSNDKKATDIITILTTTK